MRILILGSLELVGPRGEAVPLRGTKLRTLTALLAVEAGRPVSTDRLVDAVYGDDLPRCAQNALQLQVSTLRRVLREAGDGAERAVVTRPPGYVLDVDPQDVDALEFERLVAAAGTCTSTAPVEASTLLRRALDLWRGPALADFAFDDFAAGYRVRLEELRLSAIEECMALDLDLGRHGACVDPLERLVDEHPLRERAWGQLMVALYRSGRQADSLRAFERARTHLAEELGIDPGPELRRLEAAVLAQDPQLLAPPRPAVITSSARTVERPLTACIGRQRELGELRTLLGTHRLVTLVGAGGTGKTRLAVEVALAHGDAVLVDLAAVTGRQGVEAAVANALGRGDVPSLVLVDNCEHVVDAAARAVAGLLSNHPGVAVLATSREVLGVPGEALYAVAPLDQASAVELFVERAQATAPDLVVDEPVLDAVAGICVRLDGLPLAIELAAARVRALGVPQVAARLDRRFQLLTTGPRTLLPRQRTLRAVFDWSYDLLEPEERLLFERLSVFAGGAGLPAVEAVCSGDGIDADQVADVLSRLVDKSLVMVAGDRYNLLQTLAEYAAEHLADTDQLLQRKHARWLLGLVQRAERGAGTVPTVDLPELDAEADDVDAAIAWAWEHDPPLAFELTSRLGWFWFWSGRIEHGWRMLRRCLDNEIGAGDDLRARVHAWGGMLCAVA
ncbi:MAG: winged helix-turn-helix domain-containing protein, partial [Actinomycetota bacterium]|nr:winged helix-turn-helix domain-containing protein [Actinomycetota bacterium]